MKKIYQLTNRPQLIDLNGEHINFTLDFQVQSTDLIEFQALVLTQEQLDSMDLEKVDMKKATSQIGGTITAKNNKYQNYFLILKCDDDSEKSKEVIVEINLENHGNVIEETFKQDTQSTLSSNEIDSQNQVQPIYKKAWFWIFIILLIIFSGIYYYIYIYKPSLNIKSINTDIPKEIIIENPNVSLSEDAVLYNRLANIDNI